MDVEAVVPRGFCHGVVEAMTLARNAARNPKTPRPIFVLGMLVHNQHVIEELRQMGVMTLDGSDRLQLLEQVPEGATVIFSAHGVSPAVRLRAEARALHVIDATCSDVFRTHQVIHDSVERGYFIVYVGTKNHPEPEGALGHAPSDHIALVTGVQDVAKIPFASDSPIAVITQTTLSQWDTEEIVQATVQRYPKAVVFNEICMATQLRQHAIYEASRRVDAVLVVGDARSNNTKKLVEVASRQGGVPAFRIDNADQLDNINLEQFKKIAVTAGSSTPSVVTRQVIRQLRTGTGSKNLEAETTTIEKATD
ncbi:MAG: 4-hydroxy-3-methylbut-2-enyl diphosphate reductase [Firmicutes bacterium]|jgi:4-hydroxy-3-methylbut-2-enyl diphosphate reductase|nr:4-hydroxy-3-methylbut-2-enyl diphosphate reductase [Bacillota bacterium]